MTWSTVDIYDAFLKKITRFPMNNLVFGVKQN